MADQFLDLLRTRLEALLAERSAFDAQAEAIFNAAATEQRSDLTTAEDDQLKALKESRDATNTAIAAVEQRIADAEQVAKSTADAADKIQRFHIHVPKPAGGDVRGSDHTLDELLWAVAEDVPAGSFNHRGDYMPSAHNTRNIVDQVEVRNGNGEAVMSPRIDEFPENRQGAIRSFQRLVADMQTFGLLISRNTLSGAEAFQIARDHPKYRDQWKRTLRAMDTDTTAEGIEWIPTGIGATLHERIRAMGKVAALFARINIPTNPWKWPLEGSDATAYRVAEPTSDTATKVAASTPGTGAATFDAEIFGARALFSRSLEADSAVAILPYVQRKLVQAFADAEEKAILAGDSDGTHQDSDTQALGATAAETAWDGIRKRGLANSSASAGGALTVALLAARRAAMGAYGLNPSDMAFIVPISSYYALVTDASVITVDKLGPQATILNGQLGSLYGVPIIVSEHMRTNLNASGVYDGITTTKTWAAAVNRSEWVMGARTPLALETDDSLYRETYQRVVVGFLREDFQNINATSSSATDTSILYNVTP